MDLLTLIVIVIFFAIVIGGLGTRGRWGRR
jgi:hypothetical protein